MKVSDLIEQLKELPQDALVVMSSDGEGNSYSEGCSVSESHWIPEWRELWYAEDEEDQDDEEDKETGPEKVACVVLWPA